jgi:hypothetical protein
MNYIYQDKETMKPGINIFATSNLSNEIGMKLKHLSVPLILYGNCNKQYAAQPRFEVLDNLEKDNLIEQDKFNTLLENSLLRLPADKKTRKKVEKIIKIKTNTNANNSRNKSKKKKGSIGKNKKSKKKRKINV